jgi:maleylacetoacetate isomerase/maleylpyruvate isomerase
VNPADAGGHIVKLYSYFRSSASYRVRIALHWKGVKFEYVPVHLVKNGGEQHRPEYRQINPMGHVPALEHDGFLVAESMAILQYLDDVFTERPLFPREPRARARVMQLCEVLNSGIQPLQNLKVIRYLEDRLNCDKAASNAWVKHWIDGGLGSLERLLENTSGSFCFGGEVTAADCFLIPQCFASRRFNVKIEDYPNISRIEQNALKLEPFQKAHPERQPDFTPA